MASPYRLTSPVFQPSCERGMSHVTVPFLDSISAAQDWAAEHIDVMGQRLSTVQSFAGSSHDDGEGAGDVDDLPEYSSVVSGWRQLNDTVWRPCPIGMHYPVAAHVPAQLHYK